jgi:DNA-binding NarL/FixJ family response regulator
MNRRTIKVLIADDHPVIREGIRAMLETDEDIEIIGEACNGLETVTKTEELRPNVVLMDIIMPNLDGLEAIRRIKRQHPDVGIIILTIHSDKEFVIAAIQAGVGGYLLKDASRDLLRHAIKVVNDGGMLVKSFLLREAMAALLDSAMEYQPGGAKALEGVEQLTKREQEVLMPLTEGQTNKEIGNELNITEHTAKKHVQNIIAKLGVSDRTQAAVQAVRIGLVK